MTKGKLETRARNARLMAEALRAAATGRFTDTTAKELWDEYGADCEFADAKIYKTDDMLAIWTPDQNIELWDFENFNNEAPCINLDTGKAHL